MHKTAHRDGPPNQGSASIKQQHYLSCHYDIGFESWQVNLKWETKVFNRENMELREEYWMRDVEVWEMQRGRILSRVWERWWGSCQYNLLFSLSITSGICKETQQETGGATHTELCFSQSHVLLLCLWISQWVFPNFFYSLSKSLF